MTALNYLAGYPLHVIAQVQALIERGEQADVDASRDAGFAEHVVKPVDAERLLRARGCGRSVATRT